MAPRKGLYVLQIFLKKKERKCTALLTRYSKTRVSDFSVCMISCRVTMFAWRKSRSNETTIETSQVHHYCNSTYIIVEKIQSLDISTFRINFDQVGQRDTSCSKRQMALHCGCVWLENTNCSKIWPLIAGGSKSEVFLPSRIAVQGAPSSCSSRISFSATRLSVKRLLPLNTVA